MRNFGRRLVLVAITLLHPAMLCAKETTKSGARAEPLESPGNWLTDEDYPVAANLEGAEGKTGFTLAIGTDGRVTNCVITVGSGSEVLDETTCVLLRQRARFKPALNNKKVAVPGTYTGKITWRIPQNHAIRLVDAPIKRLRLSFDVDEKGMTENCTVVENVGNATYIAAAGRAVDPCEVMNRQNRPIPVLDTKGNAIKAHVETLMETKITPR